MPQMQRNIRSVCVVTGHLGLCSKNVNEFKGKQPLLLNGNSLC